MPRFEDSIGSKIKSTAVTYTIEASDVIINVTSTAAARTIATNTSDQVEGRILIIKDASGAAGTNNITFNPAGAITVDGAATAVISSNYGALRLYCDGTNWFTF